MNYAIINHRRLLDFSDEDHSPTPSIDYEKHSSNSIDCSKSTRIRGNCLNEKVYLKCPFSLTNSLKKIHASIKKPIQTQPILQLVEENFGYQLLYAPHLWLLK